MSSNTILTMDNVEHWDHHTCARKLVPCSTVFTSIHGRRVNKADQVRWCYLTLEKCKKYWRYLFSFVLSSSNGNICVLFEQTAARPSQCYAILDFCLDLFEQLITGFSNRKKAASNRKTQVIAPENIHNHKLAKFEGRKKA